MIDAGKLRESKQLLIEIQQWDNILLNYQIENWTINPIYRRTFAIG